MEFTAEYVDSCTSNNHIRIDVTSGSDTIRLSLTLDGLGIDSDERPLAERLPEVVARLTSAVREKLAGPGSPPLNSGTIIAAVETQMFVV